MNKGVKAIAIQASNKPIKDLFELAFRGKQQAKKLLGHDKFRVMPLATFDPVSKCYMLLVEYTVPDPTRRGRGLDAAMRPLVQT